MLQITIPEMELWNDETQEFTKTNPEKFQIEHSLVSISKWEARWNIPFLEKNEKTTEQMVDYIRCMTITQNVKDDVFSRIDNETFSKISTYINSPMTATWFKEESQSSSRQKASAIVTSEIIYYWMIAHNIPMECQKWHLNRLLTLIRVCNIKNSQPTKKNKVNRDMLVQREKMNAQRRQELNSKG